MHECQIAAKNADYYCARGFAHRSREDYRQALAEYQQVSERLVLTMVRLAAVVQALRLDPKHYTSYINRGVSWEKLNRPDNAVKNFRCSFAALDQTGALSAGGAGAAKRLSMQILNQMQLMRASTGAAA